MAFTLHISASLIARFFFPLLSFFIFCTWSVIFRWTSSKQILQAVGCITLRADHEVDRSIRKPKTPRFALGENVWTYQILKFSRRRRRRRRVTRDWASPAVSLNSPWHTRDVCETPSSEPSCLVDDDFENHFLLYRTLYSNLGCRPTRLSEITYVVSSPTASLKSFHMHLFPSVTYEKRRMIENEWED